MTVFVGLVKPLELVVLWRLKKDYTIWLHFWRVFIRSVKLWQIQRMEFRTWGVAMPL